MEENKYIFVCFTDNVVDSWSHLTPIQMYSPEHITQMAVERNHNLKGAEWTKTSVHH